MQLTVISENRPTLENKPTHLFLNEIVAMGVFLLKVCPSNCAAVPVMLSTEEAKLSKGGITNEGRDHLLLLH